MTGTKYGPHSNLMNSHYHESFVNSLSEFIKYVFYFAQLNVAANKMNTMQAGIYRKKTYFAFLFHVKTRSTDVSASFQNSIIFLFLIFGFFLKI